LQNEAMAMLRDQVADIVIGTVFLLIGFASCSIAAIRRRIISAPGCLPSIGQKQLRLTTLRKPFFKLGQIGQPLFSGSLNGVRRTVLQAALTDHAL